MDKYEGMNSPSKHEAIIWEITYPDNLEVFEQKGIISSYSCYNYRILPVSNMIVSIRVIANLNVFTFGDVYLTGQISRDFDVYRAEPLVFKDIILELMKSAHNEFMYLFEVKKQGMPILEKFRPSFDADLADRIASLPHSPND